jgi:hypothetical protein
VIVIEVLNHRGHDHGEEITAAMARYGYSYYRLGAQPGWKRRRRITGKKKSLCNDWLLTPDPLDAHFGERWQHWRNLLADCGPDRNPRVPFGRSMLAAARRGGIREIGAAARRYAASIRGGPG